MQIIVHVTQTVVRMENAYVWLLRMSVIVTAYLAVAMDATAQVFLVDVKIRALAMVIKIVIVQLIVLVMMYAIATQLVVARVYVLVMIFVHAQILVHVIYNALVKQTADAIQCVIVNLHNFHIQIFLYKTCFLSIANNQKEK